VLERLTALAKAWVLERQTELAWAWAMLWGRDLELV
jgi:hypothetical protein